MPIYAQNKITNADYSSECLFYMLYKINLGVET